MKRLFTLLLLSSFQLVNSINMEAYQKEPQPEDGARFIVRLFDEKPIVAIGEVHGHQQLYDFLTQLVKSPGFADKVNDIVIEAGNALYQPVLDDYIEGKAVAYSELQKVWMNTTQSPVDPWSTDVYIQFLETIRTLNQGLSSTDKIRVLAGDPPIDWDKVNTLEDYNEARGSRNTFYAGVVMKEVLAKNRKALLINGGAHFGNNNPRKTRVNQRIDKKYPNSVVVISAPAGLGRANRAHESKLANWPLGSITPVQDTWIGELPGPSRRMAVAPSGGSSQSATTATASGPPPTKKQDMFDFLLYFGGADDVEYGSIDATVFESESLWKELNRRSKIRFNHELIPETRKTGVLRPVAYR